MLVQKLYELNLIQCPYWLPSNVQYLVMTGSHSYGVETKDSDFDYYGMCIAPRDHHFPAEYGLISGFDEIPEFETWHQHRIAYEKGIDLTLSNITHYFKLLRKNNPNIIDSLFAPQSCVVTATQLANMIRDNRKIFLHKGLWKMFKGYAYSQKSEMINRQPQGARKEMVDKWGFDLKFAMNLVRLLSECEQLLIEGDLDLQESGRKAHLKSIRNGEVPLKDILHYFDTKEKQLEELYNKTKLPDEPDDVKIRALLINCLEHHYGRIEKLHQNVAEQALREIKQILLRDNL